MEGWGRLSRKYVLKFFSREKSTENRPQAIAQQVSSLQLKVKLAQIQWLKITWLIIHMIITKFLTHGLAGLVLGPARLHPKHSQTMSPSRGLSERECNQVSHIIGPVHHFGSTGQRSPLILESTCSIHSIYRPATCLRCLMQEMDGSFSKFQSFSATVLPCSSV